MTGAAGLPSPSEACSAKAGKIYRGWRGHGGTAMVVVVHASGWDETLPLRFGADRGYVPHSPSGFEWGYCGSGPAQLAFSLCLDVLGDVEKAERVYQLFKIEVVAALPHVCWELSEEEVRLRLAEIEAIAMSGT